VVVVVVVVGPWYCAGTSLLDELIELETIELETIELETIELDIELDIIELETIELDIADETELEIEDRTLLDTPGYTGGPANLTAVVIFPAA
jgi:hypothetical protein